MSNFWLPIPKTWHSTQTCIHADKSSDILNAKNNSTCYYTPHKQTFLKCYVKRQGCKSTRLKSLHNNVMINKIDPRLLLISCNQLVCYFIQKITTSTTDFEILLLGTSGNVFKDSNWISGLNNLTAKNNIAFTQLRYSWENIITIYIFIFFLIKSLL